MLQLGSHSKQKSATFLIFLLALSLLSSFVYGDVASNQQLLTPSSALAGTTVTVDGHITGQKVGSKIEVRWKSEQEEVILTSSEIQQGGKYSIEVAIPNHATPGTYKIVSCIISVGDYCNPINNEFFVGAESVFTVTKTVLDPIQDAILTPLNHNQFPSIVGGPDEGFYGPYNSFLDGITPSLFIPRCYPPEHATVLDFDTDQIGLQPVTAGTTELSSIPQNVRIAPAGTITPRKAVHLNLGIGNNYRVANFAQPQRFVGLYVGDFATSGQPIELAAFDNTGAVVALDRLAQADAMVNTCMAVYVDDEPAISTITIRTDADIYFDRLFFSSTGSLAAQPQPATGSVEFIHPALDAELSTQRRQLIVGTIRIPVGLEIEEVTLSVPRWNRSRVDTRAIDFFPLWVDGDEQLYSFVASGIYLPEGETYISVTGTGPGVIASAFTVVTGIGTPPLHDEDIVGRVDIEPITMEVTQAIRGEVSLIPPGSEIEERSDTVLVHNKKTVVRGFARLRFPNGESYRGSIPVNAELVGSRNGEALPGSPLLPRNATTNLRVWPDRAETYHSSKQQTALSWNFELPDSWTNVGEIDLQLEVNSPRLTSHIEEHSEYGGNLNTIGLNGVTFRQQPNPDVNVWMVDYYYRCGPELVDGDRSTRRAGEGATPTGAESFCMGRAEGDIVNAKPNAWHAALAVLDWWNMAPFPSYFPDRFDYFNYVFAAAESPAITLADISSPILSPGSPANSDTLGIAFRSDVIVGTDGFGTMNVLMSSFVRGKAWGSPSFFRVTPNFATTAHEGAHTMGLRHTGNRHGESWWITRWSGDHGEIGRNREIVSAFDTLNMSALPFNNRHDYMSYGPLRWSSWDVWHHVEDAVGSNIARVDNRVDEHMVQFFEELFGLGAPPDESEIITLRGSINANTVTLETGFSLPGAILVTEGDLVFRVLDENGETISEMASVLLEPSDTPEEPKAFIAPLYIPAIASELIMFYKGEEITRKPITPAPDSVILTTPEVWPEEGAVNVSWSNIGGASERHLLQVSEDNETWYTLADTTENSASIIAEQLPFSGTGWRMRVQSSSGLAIAISPTAEVTFPARHLIPKIVLPIADSTVSSNTYINLHAATTRFSKNTDALQWIINGVQVAKGYKGISVAGEPGVYEIKLKHPDSELEDSINITVVADTDLDGLPDEWETKWGMNPNDPADQDRDDDGDGLTARGEYQSGASPASIDTDGDDYSDFVEAEVGTDPNDNTSQPTVWNDGSNAPRISETANQTSPDKKHDKGNETLIISLLIIVVCVALLTIFFWRRKPVN